MRPNFFHQTRLKRLASALLMGAFCAATGGNAWADASSWVSTTAPDISPDPGAAGALSTYELEYSVDADSTTIGKHGILVGPADAFGAQEATKRPVIVFLHGQHATCLTGTATSPVPSVPSPYVSCPPANRVPSYKGYLGIQRRLATRGYISISIDANEILDNATLLQAAPEQHLALLKSWTNSAVAPNLFLFGVAQNTDFSKVVLVGHSVGAPAVNDAAYQNRTSTSAPFWKAVGQVQISGASYLTNASDAGVHTLVWLSECDNINASTQANLDLNIHHDYVTLRSAVLVRGANHNYSNSVWTDDDDDYGSKDAPEKTGLECRTKDANKQPVANPIRLSLNDQQTIIKSYITAAVSAFVSDDATAWKAIDGSPWHLPSSGAAGTSGPEIRVSGKGRRRSDFVQISADTLNIATSNTGVMTANLCNYSSCPVSAGMTGAQKAQFWIAYNSAVAVSVKWSALGSTVSLTHKPTVDGGLLGVLLPRRQVGLRIGQLPSTAASAQGPVSMNVKLRDINSNTLDLGDVTINPLVSLAVVGPVWAQEVRLPLPTATNFDLTSVVSLDLTPKSPSSGQIWVADTFSYFP
ncbi:MAG: hypothetical protein QM749_06535 [Aquabacterium sp.]